jgi:hypothetical protein
MLRVKGSSNHLKLAFPFGSFMRRPDDRVVAEKTELREGTAWQQPTGRRQRVSSDLHALMSCASNLEDPSAELSRPEKRRGQVVHERLINGNATSVGWSISRGT